MEIPQDKPETIPSRWRGLRTRITGVLPFLAVVIGCVIAGGFFFAALIVLAAVIMLKEWDKLTENAGNTLKLLGYPLTILPCACLLWLRGIPGETGNAGMVLVFALIAIIAATDIGAYFIGKRFGRFKLAPIISPNKTWEGLAGGVGASIVAAIFVLPDFLPLFTRIAVGMVLALLAQSGDLLESWVKRKAGVKDSGTLIPGHGGLLDRVDGYLLTTPVFALLVYFTLL